MNMAKERPPGRSGETERPPPVGPPTARFSTQEPARCLSTLGQGPGA